MFVHAFSVLKRNPLIYIIPIGFDLVAFLVSIMLSGFYGQAKTTFKFTLNVGLPSISSLVDRNVTANGFHVTLGSGAQLTVMAILLFIVFSVIKAFLMGGFIGLLKDTTEGKMATIPSFIQYSVRYMISFLAVEILLLFFVFVLSTILFLLLSILGAFIAIVIFFILRVLYVYLEFMIVVEDCTIGTALVKSREAFRQRTPETVNVIIVMFVINLAAAVLVNLLWNPGLFVISTIVYDFIASGLQLALMFTLMEIRGRAGEVRRLL